jgi:hypothetical protein
LISFASITVRGVGVGLGLGVSDEVPVGVELVVTVGVKEIVGDTEIVCETVGVAVLPLDIDGVGVPDGVIEGVFDGLGAAAIEKGDDL